MCKVYSQGLLMSIDDFKDLNCYDELSSYDIDTDCTELLGVKYSVAEDNLRKAKVNPDAKYQAMAARHADLFKKKPIRWLMRRQWGKNLLFVFFGKKKDKETAFPTKFEFINKTDEVRCENLDPSFLKNKEHWIQTTKIDGTSSTYILERIKKNKSWRLFHRK